MVNESGFEESSLSLSADARIDGIAEIEIGALFGRVDVPFRQPVCSGSPFDAVHPADIIASLRFDRVIGCGAKAPHRMPPPKT